MHEYLDMHIDNLLTLQFLYMRSTCTILHIATYSRYRFIMSGPRAEPTYQEALYVVLVINLGFSGLAFRGFCMFLRDSTCFEPVSPPGFPGRLLVSKLPWRW